MKGLFFNIARLPVIPSAGFLAAITRQRLILPLYHIVSDREVIHIKHIYKFRNTRAFEKDIDFLLRIYHPLSVDELVDINKNGRRCEKPSFLITFDDGLREIYENAIPVLLKKGIPAVIFINPDFIDNKRMFYRYKVSVLREAFFKKSISRADEMSILSMARQKGITCDTHGHFLFKLDYNDLNLIDRIAEILNVDFREYLSLNKPYMTGFQLNDLVNKGFSIGAHSMDHPCYADIDEEEQLSQTIKSIDFVSTHFRQKYRLFAFPFTDTGIPAAFFKNIFNESRPYADLTFGTSGIKDDTVIPNLQRIPMEIGRFGAEAVIKGEYLYYLFKAPLGKNLIRRN